MVNPVQDLSGTYGRLPITEAPSSIAYRVTASNFPTWRKALANVLSGTADAKLLCAGDSTVFGSTATTPWRMNWPAVVAALLNSKGIPAAPGLAVPPQAGDLAGDTRWTAGSGWPASRNFGFGITSAWSVSSPAGSLVFADPRAAYDRYDIYYLQNSGFGTITATATGGSPTPQSTAGTPAVTKFTASASAALTTNTLAQTATGSNYLVGIEPYTRGVKRVRVGNAGIPSSSTSTWISGSPFGSLEAIQAYAPDLTILALGVNDSINGTTAPTYLSQLAQVIAAAQTSGDVLVLTPVPSQNPPASTYEPAYSASLANSTLYPVLDIYARCVSWTAYNALGFMGDDRHPNGIGYSDLAQTITSAIL